MLCFCLMIRRPPGSTQGGSWAASDVYKGQLHITREVQSLALFCRWWRVIWPDNQNARHGYDESSQSRKPLGYIHIRLTSSPGRAPCIVNFISNPLRRQNFVILTRTLVVVVGCDVSPIRGIGYNTSCRSTSQMYSPMLRRCALPVEKGPAGYDDVYTVIQN